MADLSESGLERAVFRDADLTHANLSRAELQKSVLSGANLSGANVFAANLFRASLSGARLSGVNWTDAHDLHRLADGVLSPTIRGGLRFIPKLPDPP